MSFRRTFELYQDNDPKHTSRKVKEWCLYNCPKVIEVPAQSRDINFIENFWDELYRNVHKTQIYNVNQLKTKLTEEWNNLDENYFREVTGNMVKLRAAVIESKGYTMKY